MKIANHDFTDAEEAKRYVRALLAKYEIGADVTDEDDVRFLTEMLKLNPEFARKIDLGVRSFKVVRNRRRRATELEVSVPDGSKLQVPWAHCFL